LTYYDILEVHQGATYAEIKSSYRRLVKIYHPDVNPSALAAEKITQITNAYEVLSDPNARANYDWQISLGASDTSFTYQAPQPEPVVDEREQKRREYVKWRRKRDEELWQKRFHMKVMFYKYQRYFAYLFLLVGVIFTFDHYTHGDKQPIKIQRVILLKWGNTGVVVNGIRYETSGAMYREKAVQPDLSGYFYHSGVFGKNSQIGFANGGKYTIYGSLYQFGNLFAYLILIISAALIAVKKYNDFMLTIGLIPIFLTWFLMVFVLFT
tara:strand:+ start:2952 stop:3752 length:801 start_codon:yes stop_codon:yes gene_type:complete